jgi:hypothetical protein
VVAEGGRRAYEWLFEIDLDPDRHWRYMGTRSLGQRPWLVIDERRTAELQYKAFLLDERHDEVFQALPATEPAGREALDLILDTGLTEVKASAAEVPITDGTGTELHPLEVASRVVQEDLCLLSRQAEGWILTGGSVCFPSRWRLIDKIGRPMVDVHAPVEGYAGSLARRVDSLFDHLDDRTVWRRNWFVHPDPRLFQPQRPAGGDRVVEAERCLSGLYLRSERQTFRRLPISGAVLFTIRTQQHTLARLLEDGSRRDAFAEFVRQAPTSVASHRGISEDQRHELRLALS